MRYNLSEYRTNNFSQNGEDGVIKKLFEIASITSGWLIEFGAWDGVYLSNTREHYLKNPGFQSLLIEPNPERFELLVENYQHGQESGNAVLECQYIMENPSPNGPTLNELLEKNNIGNIALLSIDVDGPDFEIWKSLDLTRFRPNIVIIEFSRWQDPSALDQLCADFDGKEYSLVSVTGNFVFIDKKFAITSEHNVHELMRASGTQEYDHYFGFITKEEMDIRTNRQQNEKDLYKELTPPQYINSLQ